jgi:hypothetical protein
VTISFIGGAAAIVLIAVTAVFSGGPPPEPIPPPIVEIVPEPHVLTMLSEAPLPALDALPVTAEPVALEEDEPVEPRRRRHRHWRRW